MVVKINKQYIFHVQKFIEITIVSYDLRVTNYTKETQKLLKTLNHQLGIHPLLMIATA